MGIFLSDQDANKSSAQVTKEEPRTSVISVNVDNFTQYEEIIPDETVEVAEEGPNAENEVEVCEKKVCETEFVDCEKSLKENLEETELRVCIGVERDGDTFIDDQDFKKITDSQGAMFNESKGLHQSRDVLDTDRNDVADFMIQTGILDVLSL